MAPKCQQTWNVHVQGPCPSCGSENFTYFGDILTIAGNKGQNTVECGNCKTKLVFDENKREVRVCVEMVRRHTTPTDDGFGGAEGACGGCQGLVLSL